MAIDDLFQVAPEVSVERHGRAVGFRQRDGFREQMARITIWMTCLYPPTRRRRRRSSGLQRREAGTTSATALQTTLGAFGHA